MCGDDLLCDEQAEAETRGCAGLRLLADAPRHGLEDRSGLSLRNRISEIVNGDQDVLRLTHVIYRNLRVRGAVLDGISDEIGEQLPSRLQTERRGLCLGTCMNFAADAGEPLIIAEMTRSITTEYALGSEVFVAGLSAGGAMAVVMGAIYPDLFEAIGVHSGLAGHAAHDVNSAFAAMRGDHRDVPSPAAATRLIVFHGRQDRTEVPSNGERLLSSLRGSKPSASVNERQFTSGRRIVSFTETVEPDGRPSGEAWFVDGASHHWIGGDPAGSFAKSEGPSASREMVRFFLG
jgi:poly(3-hydroxybutyrate) depolymerase